MYNQVFSLGEQTGILHTYIHADRQQQALSDHISTAYTQSMAYLPNVNSLLNQWVIGGGYLPFHQLTPRGVYRAVQLKNLSLFTILKKSVLEMFFTNNNKKG